jgi:hypothetical protein
MATEIYQGTDLLLNVPVIDKDSNPVDVSVVGVDTVYALVLIGGKIVQKFATGTPPAGYFQLTVSGNNTSVDLLLEDTETKNYPVGTLYVSIVVDWTDATYTDNLRREEYPTANSATVFKGSAASI